MLQILLSNLQILAGGDDVNNIYENYHRQVLEMYNLAFPLRSRTLKAKQAARWMTHKLKECIKKKAKLYKLFLKGRVNKADYNQYKNRLTNAIRRTKALYYAKLFVEKASNSRLVWCAINGILNRKVSVVLKELTVNGNILEGEALMNYVNDYFVSIASTICAAVPNSPTLTCLAP